jgi:hypothetical protein
MKTKDITILEHEIKRISQVLNQQQNMINELKGGYFDWCDTDEVARMLKVSKRCVEDHRRSGLIPFSKLKGRVYYRKTDIHNLLLQHLVTARKP